MAFQEQQALYAQDFAESQDFELNSLPSPQLSCHVPLSTLHDWHTESCFCSGKIGPPQSMDILRVGTTVRYACEFFQLLRPFFGLKFADMQPAGSLHNLVTWQVGKTSLQESNT